jgi:nicotinamide mononucleotide transporter
MDLLNWLLEGTIPVGGGVLRVPEVLGNVFGLASALLGMRRLVWAWPVGLVGNLLLFLVFAGNEVLRPGTEPLWGQAGRQVFFAAVSLYGWWRWSRSRRAGGAADGGAITPRWAGRTNLLLLVASAVVLYALTYQILVRVGSYGPPTEAWILTGSILATYGMARGWVEFWLIWILVDVVGVTTLLQAGFYPTAAMYLFYGGFCVWGFVTWARVQRRLALDGRPGGEGQGAPGSAGQSSAGQSPPGRDPVSR